MNEFPLPVNSAGGQPFDLTAGPDGNVWFSELSGNEIGRITPAGHIDEFSIPTPNSHPEGITTGPGGNLWFVENGPFSGTVHSKIGVINTAGIILHEYQIDTLPPSPTSIALGSDGNLWFTEFDSNSIGRFNATTGLINEFTIPGSENEPEAIAAGPDGNLYFTEFNGKFIGRITTGGFISQLGIDQMLPPTPLHDFAEGITAGPDGNMWFTDSTDGKIGRISPSTDLVTYFPANSRLEICTGLDGNLWFTDRRLNEVDRMTPAGVITHFSIPTATSTSNPFGITSGPDGNIWFAESAFNAGKIGQIVLDAPGTAPDLALSGSAPASVPLGQNVTYSLTVTNGGTSGASGVTLTDTLPAGVTFDSATGGIMPVSGVLTFPLGNLARGAARTFTIVVTPTAVGTLNNQAVVSGNDNDSTPADNSLTQTTMVMPVAGMADLVLSGSAPAAVAIGQNVTYSLLVHNGGPSGATGLTLQDTLPAGVTFVSDSLGVMPVGGVLTHNLGNLFNGQSFSVTIVVTATTAGTLNNRADVSGNENDPNLANNQLIQTTVVGDLVVSTASDELDPADGKTSLREAVAFANALGGQTITFDPAVFPAGGAAMIQLINDAQHRTLELKSNLTIVGPGAKALAIIGGGAKSDFSVFAVDIGVKADISGLTVTGGHVTDFGGGIHNFGNLTLTDCTVTGNSSSYHGGGIDSSNSLTVIDCTIAGNSAGVGGGLEIVGTMTMTNTTITGNKADVGGGIGTRGGGSAALTLANCTVAGNSVSVISGGGGIQVLKTLTLRNTIVDGNLGASFSGTQPNDIFLFGGKIDASSSYNVIGAGSGLTNGVNHNQVGVADPGLGPLEDNGGPTMTMALLLGSQALDAGSNALVPVGITTDQRGQPRVFNGTVDIGAFESRVIFVPSFVVNTTADDVDPNDGTTSLREAIAFANAAGGHTITFDPAVFANHETITLSRVLPDISNTTGPTTIVGPAAGVTIARDQAAGTPEFRILTIDKNVTASLSNLTLTGGFDDVLDDGGVFTMGTLTVTDCTISDNIGSGIARGDGVNIPSGPLTLIHCTVVNNVAKIDGGGVFNTFLGVLTMTDCTVTGNKAADGGGLFNEGAATLTNCNISNNASTNGNGGGIHVVGGFLILTDSTVSGNSAGNSSGGGIANDVGLLARLTNTNITGNSAQIGGGIENTTAMAITGGTVTGNLAAFGAGLYTSGALVLTNTIVSHNLASLGGGGILGTYKVGGGVIITSLLILTDTTVSDNMSGNFGGGVFGSGSQMTLTNCTVARNSASTGGGVEDFDGTRGGAATLINCTVADNNASLGGGIYHSFTGVMTLINCTVAGNRSLKGNFGGGIFVDNTSVALDVAKPLTLFNTIVAGNFQGAAPSTTPSDISIFGAPVLDLVSAYNLIGPGGSGGVTGGFNHNLVGRDPVLGPLQDNGGPTQTMALLDGSPAFNAGNSLLLPAGVTTDQRGLPRVFAGDTIPDIGAFESQTVLAAPSLMVNTTDDELTRGDGKTSLREAIALANDLGGGTITFDPAVFPAGGAAKIQLMKDAAHRTLELKSAVTIVGPGAKALAVTGGGLTSNFGVFQVDAGVTATISGLTITGGVASRGGGIQNGGALTLTDCTITFNVGGLGGGIYSSTGSTMMLSNSTVSGNVGTMGGGGILFNGNFMTITNCTVSANAAASGGGIDSLGGDVRLVNCTFAGNNADKGGGIAQNATIFDQITLAYCTVAGNGSVLSGGGLYDGVGLVYLLNTIVAGNVQGRVGNFPGGGARGIPSDIAGKVVLGSNKGSFYDVINPTGSFYNLIGTGGAGGLRNVSVDLLHHNQVGVANPGLGPLQDNGGPTMTMALLAGSPAHNAGVSRLRFGPNTDQRGLPRVVGGAVDIGAYELQTAPVRLAANPLVPGSSAIVITGSPKNNRIVIDAGVLRIGALSIERLGTEYQVSVTLNGVELGTLFPTSRDVFIAAGKGVNRVLVKGALAGSVKLHAIEGSLHVTRKGKAGLASYTLRPHPRSTPRILAAAVVAGPRASAGARFFHP